jgi:hypothetical protein
MTESEKPWRVLAPNRIIDFFFLDEQCASYIILVDNSARFSPHLLHEFPYGIKLETWTYILAGGLGIFISQLTLSLKSIRAALANPVDPFETNNRKP